MNNFSFSNPVKIIFGKDSIQRIASEIPAENKVLMIYGGGSIKKNGVYDQVFKALKSFEIVEFPGIEVNPHYETCLKAIEVIRKEKIDFILAVGGGSVLDASKFIALGACYNGDPWDIISKRVKLEKAIPLGTILTIFATGSEMNNGGVITKQATLQKEAFHSDLAYPRFSVLDPAVTFSLPLKQVGNGIVDAFVHVVEQYLTYSCDAEIQDQFSESVLKVLIEEGPKALEKPNDYNVRANLMWASSWALNGWIGCGVPSDWATHMIGHEITAFYGLDHAQTLAIVLPGIMKVLKDQKAEKLIRMGEKVFNLNRSMNSDEKINKTIELTEKFFNQVGVKTKLSDYNLGSEVIEKVSQRMKERGWKLGEHQNIDYEIVRKILSDRK